MIHRYVCLDLQIRLAGWLICLGVLSYEGFNTHINIHTAFQVPLRFLKTKKISFCVSFYMPWSALSAPRTHLGQDDGVTAGLFQSPKRT